MDEVRGLRRAGDMPELDHTTIQAICGNWLANRLGPGCLVAVEFDDDVIGIDEKGRVTAIEVKVSWADFLREWKKDKNGFKGWHYRDSNLDHRRWYFAAPSELADKIVEWIRERKAPYGVLSVGRPGLWYVNTPSKWVSVKRKARYQAKKTALLKKSGFIVIDRARDMLSESARDQIARRCMWDALNQRCRGAGLFDKEPEQTACPK